MKNEKMKKQRSARGVAGRYFNNLFVDGTPRELKNESMMCNGEWAIVNGESLEIVS